MFACAYNLVFKVTILIFLFTIYFTLKNTDSTTTLEENNVSNVFISFRNVEFLFSNTSLINKLLLLFLLVKLFTTSEYSFEYMLCIKYELPYGLLKV